MTCGSGCCSPPRDPGDKPEINTGISEVGVEGIDKESSREIDKEANEKPAECADSCCAPTNSSGCCGDATNDQDGPKATPDDGIDDCCASVTTPTTTDDRPACCIGKTAPCCDDACIDRIALRACTSVDRCTGQGPKDGKPCRAHQRKTRSQYAARLAALGCICRALAALGQESCCVPARKGKARQRQSVKPAKLDRPMDACCTDGTAAEAGTRANHPSAADPEKAAAATTGHVVLSVAGMTCTGCETKLRRTLGMLPAVANLKISLVLSRAEFDLVAGHGTAAVSDVVRHVARTTGFTCEDISSHGSGHATLDIRVPRAQSAAALAQKDWPDGVCAAKAVDKRTVRVTFDPKVIGARDLLASGWGAGMGSGDEEGGESLTLAPPRLDPALDADRKHVRYMGCMTLASALLTTPVLVLAWAPLPDHPECYGAASLALATVVQVAMAGPLYAAALKALVFARVIEMDLLVVLSTTAAYAFSVASFVYTVAGQPLSTGSFFETSTLLVTLILLGRWVAALARHKAVQAISIRSRQTPTAVLSRDSQTDDTIDARLLQYGDVFKVMPDTTIPTDGTVVAGTSEVSEAMVTGEARPVPKEQKSALLAGSINGAGTLYARVTRLPGDNTISSIAAMVDEAKLSKPRIQALADQVASCFVPVVVGLTVATFCVWMAVGMRRRGLFAGEAAVQAVTYAMTVLIVSCPCAIGLAVPMVVVVAGGVAAERGVVFKSAAAIEQMHKATHMVLDKTGTVTQGRLTVAKEWFAGSGNAADAPDTKSHLLGLLDGIKHPVSQSVAGHLAAQGRVRAAVHDKKALPGRGVEGTCGMKSLQAGNSRWLGLGDHAVVQSMLSDGLTTFCFAIDGRVAAVVGLSDAPRPEAAAIIASLADSGIAVHLVSGDDDGAVQLAANQLGIVPARVRARCSPADKRAYVQALAVHEQETVVFVGDGTNDAAALAQATVGVHINSAGGTDVAQSAADVVLLRPDLRGLLVARAVSCKAVRCIAFNFGWSFVYNLLAILLAAGVFEAVSARNVRIPPAYAGLGELVSVLPVVVAATLLRWAKY